MEVMFDLDISFKSDNYALELKKHLKNNFSIEGEFQINYEDNSILIRSYSYNDAEDILTELLNYFKQFKYPQSEYAICFKITSFCYDETRSVNYEVHPSMLKKLNELKAILCFTFAL